MIPVPTSYQFPTLAVYCTFRNFIHSAAPPTEHGRCQPWGSLPSRPGDGGRPPPARPVTGPVRTAAPASARARGARRRIPSTGAPGRPARRPRVRELRRFDFRTPPRSPESVDDPDRIEETLREGKTDEVVLKDGLDARVGDKAWGVKRGHQPGRCRRDADRPLHREARRQSGRRAAALREVAERQTGVRCRGRDDRSRHPRARSCSAAPAGPGTASRTGSSRANLVGRFDAEEVSTDPILFETRFETRPTPTIEYLCTGLDGYLSALGEYPFHTHSMACGRNCCWALPTLWRAPRQNRYWYS